MNEVILYVNNEKYAKVLSAVNQKALEDISLLASSSETFQKAAPSIPLLFKAYKPSDLVRIVVFKESEKDPKDSTKLIQGDKIKAVDFSIQDALDNLRIVERKTVKVEYFAPRGGNGGKEREEIQSL